MIFINEFVSRGRARRRFQGDSVHLCDHQRGRDARRGSGVRGGRDRDLHVRHGTPAPRSVRPERRTGSQGMGLGRLLGQHRLRVQVRQVVHRHRRTRPQPAREDEPAQQRSRQNGE